MKKSHLFIAIATAFLVLFLGVFLLDGATFVHVGSYFQKQDPYKNSNILFYGEGCDHCDVVDVYVENNKVEEKISFIRLEVFQDTHNEKLLSDRAQICGLPIDQIGVPFYWEVNTQRCVLGDADIISFFRQKMAKKR